MPANKSDAPKGYSLHVGVNKVSKRHYNGWDGELNAPEADAIAMQQIAKDMGFKKTYLLKTTRAKRDAVMDRLLAISKALVPGDLFLLSYSGHGGQVRDINKDESDRTDETWCLYDGQLIDDEIYWCLSKFKKGVRIFSVIDSCHSGTNTKNLLTKEERRQAKNLTPKVVPLEVLRATYAKNAKFYNAKGSAAKLKNAQGKIDASVIHISACQDDQLAYDGFKNSMFTACLLKVWQKGKFKGSHGIFLNTIKKKIRLGDPNFLKYGKRLSSFSKGKPFTI